MTRIRSLATGPLATVLAGGVVAAALVGGLLAPNFRSSGSADDTEGRGAPPSAAMPGRAVLGSPGAEGAASDGAASDGAASNGAAAGGTSPDDPGVGGTSPDDAASGAYPDAPTVRGTSPDDPATGRTSPDDGDRAGVDAWVGPVSNGGGVLAVVARGNDAIAYLTDGRRTGVWLSGTAARGRLALSGPGAGGARLSGRFVGDRAAGTVAVAGRPYRFDVPVVPAPAGLYAARTTVRGAVVTGGWIVLTDGTQVGLGTVGGRTAGVTPVADGRATVGGAPVTVRTAVPPGKAP